MLAKYVLPIIIIIDDRLARFASLEASPTAEKHSSFTTTSTTGPRRMSNSSDYGISYTPSNLDVRRPSIGWQELEGMYRIQYVRLTWVDYACKTRFRVIPIAHLKRILGSPRPSIGLPKSVLGLALGRRAVGFSSIGEYLYLPDMQSWRISGYEKGTATVMGWFEEKTPHPVLGLSVPLCPRSILKRIVA